MKKKQLPSSAVWHDEDDAPAWSQEQIERAELAVGGVVLQEAKGTLTRPRGRPKKAQTKELVRIRLSPEVMHYFRASGRGWQTRIDEALRAFIA